MINSHACIFYSQLFQVNYYEYQNLLKRLSYYDVKIIKIWLDCREYYSEVREVIVSYIICDLESYYFPLNISYSIYSYHDFLLLILICLTHWELELVLVKLCYLILLALNENHPGVLCLSIHVFKLVVSFKQNIHS